MSQATMTLLLVLLTILSLATCQTFQYSRGWTNGKRSELLSSPLSPADLDVVRPIYRCANLHKWRMFLQTGDNEEICRVPCEFLDVLRQCLLLFQHEQQQQQQDKVVPSVYKRSAPADGSSISY